MPQKWQSLVYALTGGGSGILEGGNNIDNSSDVGDEMNIDDIFELIPRNNQDYKDIGQDESIELEDSDEFVKLYISIGKFLDEKGIPREVKISEAHTEILLRFKDSVLFDTGEAEIKDEAKEILKEY